MDVVVRSYQIERTGAAAVRMSPPLFEPESPPLDPLNMEPYDRQSPGVRAAVDRIDHPTARCASASAAMRSGTARAPVSTTSTGAATACAAGLVSISALV